MFNLSNNKNYNPDKEMLGNLSVNQKKSVINLLYLIARSDGDFTKKEIEYLDTFDLGYSVEECSSYLNMYGNGRTLDDLKQLTSSQKDYLLTTAFDLMCCDGKPNEKEISDFVFAFEKLGYTQDDIANTLEKFALLRKKFM